MLLSWLTQLKPEEAKERIEQAWENIVRTEDGQIVIASLLEQLRFLEPIVTEDQQTRHNVAVMVLNLIGRNSIPRVVDALVIGRNEDARTERSAGD